VGIVWDEPKRLEYISKHGFDFAGLNDAFFENSAIIPAARGRLKALGTFSSRMLVIIFFALGREGISVISMRLANRKERRQYEEALARTSTHHR
jgi:uncharacterized DUF497 family protein